MTDAVARECEQVFDSRFHELLVCESVKLVVLRRKPESFRQPAEWEGELRALLRELRHLARPGRRLLCDLRAVTGRNDRQFEVSTYEFRRCVLTLYEPTAVVVRTAAGRMQVTRHIREAASNASVFEELRAGAMRLGIPLSLADRLDPERQAMLREAASRMAFAVGQR